jgi:hypothetical protein
MSEVPDDVERLFAKGEEFVDAGEDVAALNHFRAAWELLPVPKEEQGPAIQLLAAIADSCFFLGDWEGCRQAVQHAFRAGADVANPFLRLRLGQSLYELGNTQEAANWLVPVYLHEGRQPFEGEDPKYLEFFRDRLQPPSGGWPEGW